MTTFLNNLESTAPFRIRTNGFARWIFGHEVELTESIVGGKAREETKSRFDDGAALHWHRSVVVA